MAATRGGRRSTPTPKPKKPKHKKSKTPLDRQRLISAAASATAAAYRFLLRHDLHLLPSQTLTLHSLLSSLSVSLSQSVSPSHSWFHRLLSSSPSSDHRWPLFFRLSKPSFTLLLRLLSPQLSSLPFPPSAALAAALFRLAHSAPYETLARLFDLGHPSSACRAFFAVCKSIHDRLSHLFEFKSDVNRVVVGFGWISLPNCCGVLGFGRFPVNGHLLGENGSLFVQAVVDSEGRFLDVSAGWPSTMKPVKILRQSKLVSGIETSREYLNGDCYKLSDGSLVPQYLLGDSCFPLLPWLITPYSEPEGEMETDFNLVHRKGMDLVGTAFGRVREVWKIVSGEWREECVEYFPFVVVTCCLLHNYLIKCSEEFQFLEEDVEYESDRKLPMFEGEEDGEGRRIRDALASHLNRALNWRVPKIKSYTQCEGDASSFFVDTTMVDSSKSKLGFAKLYSMLPEVNGELASKFANPIRNFIDKGTKFLTKIPGVCMILASEAKKSDSEEKENKIPKVEKIMIPSTS